MYATQETNIRLLRTGGKKLSKHDTQGAFIAELLGVKLELIKDEQNAKLAAADASISQYSQEPYP